MVLNMKQVMGVIMNMWMTAELLFRDQTAEWDQETMRCLREQHIQVCGIAVGRLCLPE